MGITSIVSINALASGSYRRRASPSEMMFLKPTAQVVFVVTLALYVAELCAVVASPKLLDTVIALVRGSLWTHPEVVKDALLWALPIAAVYAGAIWWYRKTFALVLNLDRRTYRTMDFTGGNLCPKTGTWEDIAGICIKQSSTKGGRFYFVQLKWCGQAKLAASLGGFSKLDRAEAFAAQIGRELGLPVVGSEVRNF